MYDVLIKVSALNKLMLNMQNINSRNIKHCCRKMKKKVFFEQEFISHLSISAYFFVFQVIQLFLHVCYASPINSALDRFNLICHKEHGDI